MKRLELLIIVIILLAGCTNYYQDKDSNRIYYDKVIMINDSKQIEQNYNYSVISNNETIVKNYNNVSTVQQEIENITIETEKENVTITNDKEKLEKFKEWAKERQIILVGINKSTNYFYYNGSMEGDFLIIDNVPNVLEAAEGVYLIPEDLLRAMKGKTFYLSHQQGRGYTVLGSWPEQGILTGMNKGSIIEQRITREQIIHEFAHILDYHGIRGMYEDPQNHWKNLDGERAEIFNVTIKYDPNLSKPPEGHMDVYSTANDAENFAQHFTFYILRGNEFRENAKNNTLLRKKYEFFRDMLFDEKEY